VGEHKPKELISAISIYYIGTNANV
jgi:hypothetical protein